MSCFNDDSGMYAPSDLMDDLDDLSYDTAALMKLHTTFSPSCASTVLLSTSSSTLSHDSDKCQCDCAPRLAQQRTEIASLQQDVFALRHLFDSELSRMKQEMKQSLLTLEKRLTQRLLSANTSTNSAESKQTEAAAVSTMGKSASLRRSVWSGDFTDAECGDDFAPLHPSEFSANDQEAIAAAMLASLTQSSADKNGDSEVPPVMAALSATAVPGTKTALSISSLTALINPHGQPVNEEQLIALACRILNDHGSVPVGKMGSLLHKAANDHTLPSLLKERYGGLKKFLQAHTQYFVLGEDHPYNPHVALVGQQSLPPPTSTITQTNSGTVTACNTTNNVSALSMASINTNTGTVSPSYAHGSYSKRLSDSLTLSRTLNFSTKNHGRLAAIDALLTDVLGVDCEMVGVGIDANRSMLARCSIVNYYGQVVYDQFIQPTEIVSDYRTHVSGILPGQLDSANGAIPYHQAHSEIAVIVHGRTLVAHSIVNDLSVLGLLNHPLHLIRDTAHFPLLCPERPRSLRSLVSERLRWLDFQCGCHDSVEDARAVVSLYRLYQPEWEALIQQEQQSCHY